MKSLLGLAACILPLMALAEYVVPVESVEEHVNVRMVPDAHSEIVGRFYRGDAAKLVRAGTEWHEIEIAGGATGFISADWTNVVADVPRPAQRGADTQPLARTESAAVSTAPATPQESAQVRKENVAELTPEEALAALANIEPVTFNYRENDRERHVGFSAGNDPELVAGTESEGLKPLEIVAVLTKVVKLQQHQIAELEARLQERN